MKISRKHVRIMAGAGVAAVLAAGYFLMHMGEETTDDAAIEARVVAISPKVSGYVKVLAVEDNQKVKAGDVLLEIDPADYINRRDRARATRDAAAAQVVSAQATLEKAQSDLNRMQHLSDQARSREQLEQATSAEKAAQAYGQQLAAQVKQAEADLAQAEKDLADTRVIAPMDGHITKRSVERGDYVQTGQQLGYLVGSDLWVVANFKEVQLRNIHPGQPVSLHIDAFPKHVFPGKVDSFQLGTGTRFSAFPPENATGNFVKIVQRVPVKILFTEAPDPALPLGPGMSVVPVVHTR